MLNNLFLTTACATVFVGTLYPLALEALTGEKISVGAPFFNATFGPLFIPLLIAVPFGPLLAWKRGDLLGVAQRLIGAAAIAADRHRGDLRDRGRRADPGAVRRRACVLRDGRRADRSRRAHRAVPGAASAALRARCGLPRSAWGTAFAHFGLGVTLLGIVGETQWGIERIAALKPGQTISIRRYDLHFDGMTPRDGPELSRARRELHRAAARRGHRRDGAVQAHLSVAQHAARPKPR